MNEQDICSSLVLPAVTLLVHAFLWLDHRVWGLRWEAVIDSFHNYLYAIQSIQISKNIDFCQHLLHKPKHPQKLHCFPKWQEKLQTSHCACWVCCTVHFNYSCHWEHLIMCLLKNQHLRLPDPKFPSPFLNQYSWQKYSWFSPWVLILIWIQCLCLRRS